MAAVLAMTSEPSRGFVLGRLAMTMGAEKMMREKEGRIGELAVSHRGTGR